MTLRVAALTSSDITSSDQRERGKYVSNWCRKEVQISYESGMRVASGKTPEVINS